MHKITHEQAKIKFLSLVVVLLCEIFLFPREKRRNGKCLKSFINFVYSEVLHYILTPFSTSVFQFASYYLS